MKVLRTKTQWYWDQNRQKKNRTKKTEIGLSIEKFTILYRCHFKLKWGKERLFTSIVTTGIKLVH